MPKHRVSGGRGARLEERLPMAGFPTQFDRDDLLKCARGELFGPGNAQLPEPPMLMMDRITDI